MQLSVLFLRFNRSVIHVRQVGSHTNSGGILPPRSGFGSVSRFRLLDKRPGLSNVFDDRMEIGGRYNVRIGAHRLLD